jgi:hypothetical protein
MNSVSTQDVRRAIIAALPADTSLQDRAPEPRHVYVPPSHIKALRLENDLVIGGRGVGKTFWGAALREAAIRRMLGESVPDLPEIKVQSGFGEQPEVALYPDAEIFSNLIAERFEPFHVWRAVVWRWASTIVGADYHSAAETWKQIVTRVTADPESFARLLERANHTLLESGKHGLIIFDALDRTSSDWTTMDTIVRDLLRVALALKPFSRLHAKVFLREDQFYNRLVTNFPDSSKLQSSRVELTWAPHDLHGLLWQYLLNAEIQHGDLLRKLYQNTAYSSLAPPVDGIWQLPEKAKREGALQEGLFAALAGAFMGKDRRRGVTYTWVVGHLADARRRTSPRSFIAAIRAAAVDSLDRYPDHLYPLHYESIKRGVQAASAIRVSEMAEDYPWVKGLLDPLSGLNVPCEADFIDERWHSRFGESPKLYEYGKLPPEHVGDGWEGVRRDLITLGIFETMKDGRINMPDLYRVGFGLGRRGGVKPMARDTAS